MKIKLIQRREKGVNENTEQRILRSNYVPRAVVNHLTGCLRVHADCMPVHRTDAGFPFSEPLYKEGPSRLASCDRWPPGLPGAADHITCVLRSSPDSGHGPVQTEGHGAMCHSLSLDSSIWPSPLSMVESVPCGAWNTLFCFVNMFVWEFPPPNWQHFQFLTCILI